MLLGQYELLPCTLRPKRSVLAPNVSIVSGSYGGLELKSGSLQSTYAGTFGGRLGVVLKQLELDGRWTCTMWERLGRAGSTHQDQILHHSDSGHKLLLVS